MLIVGTAHDEVILEADRKDAAKIEAWARQIMLREKNHDIYRQIYIDDRFDNANRADRPGILVAKFKKKGTPISADLPNAAKAFFYGA